MRSPITRTPSMRSGVTGVHTKLAASYVRLAGVLPASTAFNFRIYSGEVPQQPPKMVTPASRHGRSALANASGPMS